MGSRPAAGRPAISTCPEVGSTMRLNRRSSVVLPLPLSPTSASVSPACTSRLTPSSARVPSGQILTTSMAARAAAGSGIELVYPGGQGGDLPPGATIGAPMKSELLRFPGTRGARLAGRLDQPDGGPPAAYALFAHCFTCSKDLAAAGGICRELAARDIAVLRLDFTGIGESEGDLAATNFSTNLEDLLAAAEFLRRERQAPRLLVGHSLGGTAMLAVAPRIPEAAAVATLGAPSSTRHLRSKLIELAPELADDRLPGDAEVLFDLGGLHPVRLRRQLLEDLDREPLQEVLPRLHRALLLFHSPADNVVGVEHARRIFLAARHPKSFVSLGTADHLLSDPRDAHFAGSVLAAWAERYL